MSPILVSKENLRSHLKKKQVLVVVGLIDAGYRGELLVAVDNIKSEDYHVEAGARLVQAVFFDGKPFSFQVIHTFTSSAS